MSVVRFRAPEHEAANLVANLVEEDHPGGANPIRSNHLTIDDDLRLRFTVREDESRRAVRFYDVDAMHGDLVELRNGRHHLAERGRAHKSPAPGN